MSCCPLPRPLFAGVYPGTRPDALAVVLTRASCGTDHVVAWVGRVRGIPMSAVRTATAAADAALYPPTKKAPHVVARSPRRLIPAADGPVIVGGGALARARLGRGGVSMGSNDSAGARNNVLRATPNPKKTFALPRAK